ncbi:hypothetical protein DCAR_0933576 [Daucus carota subsp. sativus]|uniref:Uncharacterized protein n=1 Tax=Daucus carota subsp. sativus TaxID=79200 RepID=A0A175YFI1_DAUCS|nr:hypothetical protein DCAR_0933576 [Daucus carota subsp. sativus]
MLRFKTDSNKSSNQTLTTQVNKTKPDRNSERLGDDSVIKQKKSRADSAKTHKTSKST